MWDCGSAEAAQIAYGLTISPVLRLSSLRITGTTTRNKVFTFSLIADDDNTLTFPAVGSRNTDVLPGLQIIIRSAFRTTAAPS